ncbi:hypothetical protein GQ43DRAFT_471297 [Delitschia confertaspora ATCC 74209]|uniref:Ankyrin repeat protein n=1 Tax=Delitschia confertaspora ATCC 74209 TaxID=1513339 RepID=A0A9P4JMW4_9PLEO|nr:hypothetical protein GQ43DRAFT_471297 [Delitschia confertaspora ATCC 74209]
MGYASGDGSVRRAVVCFGLSRALHVIFEDSQGWRPIMTVVSDTTDDANILEAFIAAGASLMHKDATDITPLHCTTQPSIAESLIRNGADIHARDIDEKTALHGAF